MGLYILSQDSCFAWRLCLRSETPIQTHMPLWGGPFHRVGCRRAGWCCGLVLTSLCRWRLQDIEKTMSTALNELRELERQNTAKQAPDVVLDTLEPMKNPPMGAANSEPASPLHTILIRDPDAAMRRSSSSTTEMMTTFKPALSAWLAGAQLRPPPMRPVRPVVQHRSSSSSSSGVGSPAVTPTEKLFPSSSADKSGTM